MNQKEFIEKHNTFVKYVAKRTPINEDVARGLFPICDMFDIKKEEVVEDLKINMGDWCKLYRKYYVGGGR
jgi:predicted homoserine dehydrogenase-like protein